MATDARTNCGSAHGGVQLAASAASDTVQVSPLGGAAWGGFTWPRLGSVRDTAGVNVVVLPTTGPGGLLCVVVMSGHSPVIASLLGHGAMSGHSGLICARVLQACTSSGVIP